MHANTQNIESDLPSIDDTIAAVSILGQILEEMRNRLTVAERAVASLEEEKLVLRAELQSFVDHAALRLVTLPPTQSNAPIVTGIPLNDGLVAILKEIDCSFTRGLAA